MDGIGPIRHAGEEGVWTNRTVYVYAQPALAGATDRTGDHSLGSAGIGKELAAEPGRVRDTEPAGGMECPAFKAELPEMEMHGMIFAAYRDLLRAMRGHAAFGWFRSIMGRPGSGTRCRRRSTRSGYSPESARRSSASLPGHRTSGTKRSGKSVSAFPGTLGSALVQENRFVAILFRTTFTDLQGLICACRAASCALPLRESPSSSPADPMSVPSRHMPTCTGKSDCGVTMNCLSPGCGGGEIRGLAMRRFGFSIADSTARILHDRIGDPLRLTVSFNLVRSRNMAPGIERFRAILPDVQDPAAAIYAGLDEQWTEWANALCVLNLPFPAPIIARMLDARRLMPGQLQQALERGHTVLRRVSGDGYDFAHLLLREHCRRILTEGARVAFHSRAARCFKHLMPGIPDNTYALISIADHLYAVREYGKAMESNLELGSRFYHLAD